MLSLGVVSWGEPGGCTKTGRSGGRAKTGCCSASRKMWRLSRADAGTHFPFLKAAPSHSNQARRVLGPSRCVRCLSSQTSVSVKEGQGQGQGQGQG
jgi:hypothetical protein